MPKKRQIQLTRGDKAEYNIVIFSIMRRMNVKKFSKILCAILTLCMMLTILPFGAFAESVSFTDVKGNWAEEYIMEMANKTAKDGSGYVIGGYSDGTFRPGDNITRGAVAAILDRAYGFKATGATKDFSDVAKENTFYKNIMACADNGVINGYSDGSFKPASSITRQAAIAMIARCAMTKDNYNQFSDKTACKKLLSDKFKDADQISEQFYAEFCYLCTYGNLDGYADGTVKPGQNITRAQFVKLLSTTKIDNPGSVVPGKTYTLKLTLTSGNDTLSASATKLQSNAVIVDEIMGIAVANESKISAKFPTPSGSKSLNAYITIYEMCDEEGWNDRTKENWNDCISASGDPTIISACSDPQSTATISTLSCSHDYNVTITDSVRTYNLTVTLVEE